MEGLVGSDECRGVMEDLEESGSTDDEVAVEFTDGSDGTVGNSLGLHPPGEPTLADVRAAVEGDPAASGPDESVVVGEVRHRLFHPSGQCAVKHPTQAVKGATPNAITIQTSARGHDRPLRIPAAGMRAG